MIRHNIKPNYNGTAFFGSIFGSLFSPMRKSMRPKNEKVVPINLQRAY